MDWLRETATKFMALSPEAKAIIFGAVVFLVIRVWLAKIGAWPFRGNGDDGGLWGDGGDGDGGCD